jgi:uncharacterized membrane-anchored protein YitT (DUF2179 family)
MKQKFYRFFLLTVSTLTMAVGIYFFKFPNYFSFGGVTGLAVVVAKVVPYTASTISFIMNMILLAVGFLFLGRNFGIMTAYSSLLLSVGLTVLERICPMRAPLTDQPMLELCYAIALPAMASAVLFHIGASSGGTDILAMIFKKYSGGDIGVGLFITDLIVVVLSFFVFDIRTGLFSFVGLMVKSLVIDNVIESINLCKYFNIICDDPEPICSFIVHRLGRSATVCAAQGAFTHGKKHIVFTALKRPQAVALRKYVRTVEPTAFILVTNTSEIIGKGFQSYDL